MSPSVMATAACLGLRPVAKALGWGLGLTYSLGMGISALAVSSSMMAWYWGSCAEVTGTARAEAMASLSLNQYEPAHHDHCDDNPDGQSAAAAQQPADGHEQRRHQHQQEKCLERVHAQRSLQIADQILEIRLSADGVNRLLAVVVAGVDVDAGDACLGVHLHVAGVVLEGAQQLESVLAEIVHFGGLVGP